MTDDLLYIFIMPLELEENHMKRNQQLPQFSLPYPQLLSSRISEMGNMKEGGTLQLMIKMYVAAGGVKKLLKVRIKLIIGSD